jgi:hypothetical protein
MADGLPRRDHGRECIHGGPPGRRNQTITAECIIPRKHCGSVSTRCSVPWPSYLLICEAAVRGQVREASAGQGRADTNRDAACTAMTAGAVTRAGSPPSPSSHRLPSKLWSREEERGVGGGPLRGASLGGLPRVNPLAALLACGIL